MEKMNGISMDLNRNNTEIIKELFPNVVTEGKIDFDALRTMLGDEIVSSKEKYQFTWNGKTESIKLAQSPSTATLRPCKEKSKDWNTTENLYIEGDNLEVLKQLQKTYYGKIKMIYIDPPYNTGNDFVYKDNFKDSMGNYKEQTKQSQKSNPETSGRFHSDWLNMMYPRLILSRNLLSEKGVIFISIDEHELDSLIKICDEIFGMENRVGAIIIKSNPRGSMSTSELASLHEYLLLYTKKREDAEIIGHELSDDMSAEYKLSDDKGAYRLLGLRMRGGFWRRSERPNLYFPIYVNPDDGQVSLEKNTDYSEEALPIQPSTLEEGTWRWSKERIMENAQMLIGKQIRRGDSMVWDIYQKDYLDRENGRRTKAKSIWDDNEVNYQNGSIEIKELLGSSGIFDYSKPVFLLEKAIGMIQIKDRDLILDFFSGSATTAHAVLKYSIEKKQHPRFIMVQLPEKINEKTEAYKAGYRTICEIGEERIRKAGETIKEEWQQQEEKKGLLAEKVFPVDIGFKVFKLDSTNINPWDNAKELDEQTLLGTAEVFKQGRSKEDVLYEIMLKYGVFDQPASEVDVNSKKMYRVGHRHMIVCLEDEIDDEDIAGICELGPRVVIFKEDGFKDDNAKINAEYNLKKAGVEDVKCI